MGAVGYGPGYGYGSGYGDGSGSGYGYGSGDGSGSGYGYGDGSCYGDGSGSGYGDGSCYGYGDGSGDGYGYGSGYGNSGDRNSGDYNSGDYNSGDYNSGLFNTNEPKMRLFNRECKYTYSEFLAKFGNRPLNPILTEWILSTDMTDAEKEKHPSHETTGGYLKTFTYKEAWSNAWKNADDKQKRWFLSLPNFDADIFFQITGIRV